MYAPHNIATAAYVLLKRDMVNKRRAGRQRASNVSAEANGIFLIGVGYTMNKDDVGRPRWSFNFVTQAVQNINKVFASPLKKFKYFDIALPGLLLHDR
ncbi:hypothetical protein EVAR_91379_1 [Eumeta japonica]|uniref:Uncharacterized protein n=1 Tax=Eumeta variegata TaxID=151549 RepID=A0A4C1XD17_EUMVA|nr:hypothetical protein EVAR_91379_1 [Eumeta japonica]